MRPSLVAIVLVLLLALAAPVSGRQSRGQLVGLFTLTGSCKGGCTFAMSGVVTVRTASGKVHRIEVNRKDHLRPKYGRFSANLPPGTYQISDTASPSRGGGSCGVFLTGRRFRISNAFAPVTSISIKHGKATYVHINCFGH